MLETVQIQRQRQPHQLDDEHLRRKEGRLEDVMNPNSTFTIEPPQSDQQNVPSLGNEDEEFAMNPTDDEIRGLVRLCG